MPVVSMTQTEAFNYGLAKQNDVTVLRGKFIFTSTANTTPTPILNLAPSFLGTRAFSLGSIYAHYRFKYVRVRFSANSTSTLLTTVGIVDDTVTATTPSSISAIAELRNSAVFFGGSTTPITFNWEPVDKSLWRYTTSGIDPRLTQTAFLVVGSNGTTTAQFEVDFCIVFKGAIDVGTS